MKKSSRITVGSGPLELSRATLRTKENRNQYRNSSPPKLRYRRGILAGLVKISLGRVWRRITFSATDDMDLLSSIILEAFEFDNDHLYQFTYRDRKGLPIWINAPEMEEDPITTEVLIGDIGLSPGDQLEYLFDFGDQWKFQVQLEKIVSESTDIETPSQLESYGTPPLQYEDFSDDF